MNEETKMVFDVLKDRTFNEMYSFFKENFTLPVEDGSPEFDMFISGYRTHQYISNVAESAYIKFIITPLLELFQMNVSVFVVTTDNKIVLNVNQKAIAFSIPVLEILDSEEIFAVSAHELAHNLFSKLHAKAIEENKGQRHIELLCDGLAVLALNELGLNSDGLIDGLNKIGYEYITNTHPSNSQRISLIMALDRK